MTTTVEVLATVFKDAGTPFIVGHPGGESVELMEAPRQRQMRFLLMKQEIAGTLGVTLKFANALNDSDLEPAIAGGVPRSRSQATFESFSGPTVARANHLKAIRLLIFPSGIRPDRSSACC
jgi:hypothetical protein